MRKDNVWRVFYVDARGIYVDIQIRKRSIEAVKKWLVAIGAKDFKILQGGDA